MGIDGNYGYENKPMLDAQLQEKTDRKDKLEGKRNDFKNILKPRISQIGKGNALTRLAEKVGNFFVTIGVKFELICIERSLKSLDQDIKNLIEGGAEYKTDDGPSR